MELFYKAKGFFTAPRKEWDTIALKTEKHTDVLRSYLLLIALIPAAAQFIGWGLVGYSSMGVHIGGAALGLRYAVSQYISVIVGVYVTAAALRFAAPAFGAVKDFDRAFQLAAYCYTAVCVGGIFYVFPPLSFIAGLAGIYTFYLLYIGIRPVMKAPADKVTGYFIVSLLCMIIAYGLVGWLTRLLFGLSI